MTDDLIEQITNDITTRLRVKARHVRLVLGFNEAIVLGSLEEEAANEIERLRLEIYRLQNKEETE